MKFYIHMYFILDLYYKCSSHAFGHLHRDELAEERQILSAVAKFTSINVIETNIMYMHDIYMYVYVNDHC